MNDANSLAQERRVLGDVTDPTQENVNHDELSLINGDDNGNASTCSCHNNSGGENKPLPEDGFTDDDDSQHSFARDRLTVKSLPVDHLKRKR